MFGLGSNKSAVSNHSTLAEEMQPAYPNSYTTGKYRIEFTKVGNGFVINYNNNTFVFISLSKALEFIKKIDKDYKIEKLKE